MDFINILREITPSKDEKTRVHNLAHELIEIINQEASQENISARAVLVGSVAKETWLSGKADIDIFIEFPLETPLEKLKIDGLELGYHAIRELNGESEERYASHPYVTGTIQGYQVDFVPCYSISQGEELKSAVDRTILHTRYVQHTLKPEQRSEVLLLKRFMETAGCYGSEFKVGGFPGYLAELFIINYGSFQETMRDVAQNWEPGYIIDLKSYDTGNNFTEPLIVVDPVDKNRNVAAALTIQKMAEFKVAAINYYQTPRDDFFYPIKTIIDEKILKNELIERDTQILLIIFDAPEIPEDALYPQIRKTESSLVKILDNDGFRVFGSVSFLSGKKIIILLELEVWNLPSVKKHGGPLVWNQMHGKKFQEKYHKDVWIEYDRWVALIPRKYTHPSALLEFILSADGIHHLRTGRHLKKQLLENYAIMDMQQFLEQKRRPEHHEEALRNLYHYLHKNEFYIK